VYKFGQRISIPENFEIKADDRITEVTHKIAFEFARKYDQMAIDSIIEGAKKLGLTEVVIWDGKKIVEALKKQIPDNVIMTEDECICPSCRFDMMGRLDHDSKHCPECGQKLIWGD
jgi:hypothetical protein